MRCYWCIVCSAGVHALPVAVGGMYGGRHGDSPCPSAKQLSALEADFGTAMLAGADGDAPAAGKGPSAVVKFSSSGDMLFVGHAKGGLISVLDVPSLSYLDIVKVCVLLRLKCTCLTASKLGSTRLGQHPSCECVTAMRPQFRTYIA